MWLIQWTGGGVVLTSITEIRMAEFLAAGKDVFRPALNGTFQRCGFPAVGTLISGLVGQLVS